MLFVILATLFFSTSHALAAIAPENVQKKAYEVPYYKSTSSLFPSGSTNLENLRKQLVSAPQTAGQYYRWNKLLFAQDELKPLFAVHLSQFVVDPLTNTRFKVVEATVNTLLLLDVENKQQIKKNAGELQADAYDLGFVMTLKDAYLKSKDSESATILTTIPQGTRLTVEKYANEFALVNYQKYEGFINLSELITKFDFATFVFADNNWHQVGTRQFDKIVSVNRKTIPLNSIKGLITPDVRGIIASSTQKIPLWSQVEAIRDKLSVWHQSRLKDHGLVWWKAQTSSEQIYFTIDDLLKKEISSVSFHPQNPLKGLLSSDGVFITEDGFYWRKLPRFEKFNGPVHYFNDLLLFVGTLRSTDGGVTFDNYIQIDKLAAAIELQYGFFPKKMQVKKIETKAPMKLKIEIETGVRKIKMESPLFAQDWQSVKN